MAASQSTTQRGDAFRDTVGRMLRASGMEFEAEVRRDHTKVDGVTWLQRVPLGDTRRIFVETKDYKSSVDQATCAEFAGKYRPEVDRGEYTEAWLVSKGPITPDGRKLLEAHKGLRWLTFEKLQRGLMNMDSYMLALRKEYEEAGVEDYYVEPRLQDGTLLDERVRAWLADPASATQQFAIVGRYGIGKSTYSLWLSAALAREATERDATSRVPIRIPLAEVFDDQSIEGLIGKVLGNRNPPVQGYSYPLFAELNRAGRFVIIFDGFDEMKHGMTATQFEQNVNRFMALDRGSAKLIILGRDTAFHTDREFKAVIEGRQVTAGGQEVPTRDRRPLTCLELGDFTPDGARSFVSRYLPHAAWRWAGEAGSGVVEAAWLSGRLRELTSGEFDTLLQRPVHAQMLCDIASRPGAVLDARTQYNLYDQFVHYLIEREVRKLGRYPGFDVALRRRFNAALAWWLLSHDSASTTTLDAIPEDICWDVTRGAEHPFDAIGLRRELAAGCLIEKGGERVYFGHRSIQEFLAAEHLIDTNLLQGGGLAKAELRHVLALLTPEGAEFLRQRLEAPDGKELARAWLGTMDKLSGSDIEPSHLRLFRFAAVVADPGAEHAFEGAWPLLAGYFVRNQACAFVPVNPGGAAYLARVRSELRRMSNPAKAAALMLLVRVIREGVEHPPPNDAVRLLTSWLPVSGMAKAANELRTLHRSQRHQVQRDDDLLFWSWSRTVTLRRDTTGKRRLRVDLALLERLMAELLGFGFAHGPQSAAVEVDVAQLLREMDGAELSEADTDAVQRFLRDTDVQERIHPVVVVESAVPGSRGRLSLPATPQARSQRSR